MGVRCPRGEGTIEVRSQRTAAELQLEVHGIGVEGIERAPQLRSDLLGELGGSSKQSGTQRSLFYGVTLTAGFRSHHPLSCFPLSTDTPTLQSNWGLTELLKGLVH